MNRYSIIGIGILFFLWLTGEKKTTDKDLFRFMEKNRDGMTILQIAANNDFICVTGRIFMSDGNMEASLLNAENLPIYSIRFITFNKIIVDGAFCPESGVHMIHYSTMDWLLSVLLIFVAIRGIFRRRANPFLQAPIQPSCPENECSPLLGTQKIIKR